MNSRFIYSEIFLSFLEKCDTVMITTYELVTSYFYFNNSCTNYILFKCINSHFKKKIQNKLIWK